MSKKVLGLLLLALSVTSAGCGSGQELPPRRDAAEIAQEVSKGVGVVGRTFQGGKGAPVILLEERHDSKAGQVEHAIALVRLHEQYGLRDVGLEGYLKEDPSMKADDMAGLSPRSDALARARVAAQLLQDGEIGGSEFLKMVYNDVSLFPIERKEDRRALAFDKASDLDANIAHVYLVKMAEQSLSDEQRETAAVLLRRNQRQGFDYIISADAWAKSKADILNAEPAVEKEYETLKEISDRAAHAIELDITPEDRDAMASRLDFLGRRVKASEIMSESAAEVADRAGVGVVALNVGEGHTQAICDKLQSEGRPFAVITPNSMKDKSPAGKFTAEEMKRKYGGLSPYPDGIIDRSLSTALSRRGPGALKPPLVLPQRKFRAKAELYDIIDRVTHAVLLTAGGGGAGPTPTPGVVPQGTQGGGRLPLVVMTDDNFRNGPPEEFEGEFVAVDRGSVGTITIPETGRTLAVIPVTLDPKGPARTEMWVVTDGEEGSGGDDKSVEAVLQKVLQKIKLGAAEVRKALGKKASRVQISINTRAIVAATREDAISAAVRY